MNILGKISLALLVVAAVAGCSTPHRAFVGAGDPHATLVTNSPLHNQPSMYYFFNEGVAATINTEVEGSVSSANGRMGTRGTLVSENMKPGEYVYPVTLVAINGKNVVSPQLSYYVRPGDHEIVVSVVVRVDAGLQRSIEHGEIRGHMKINVEPGKRYYLGGKYNPKESRRTRDWEPVIYRIEDSKS
jgi:hypothetical protein